MDNRIAIVTGASAGIGAATAIRIATQFSGVVLVARREKELEETAASVKTSGATPLVIANDVPLFDVRIHQLDRALDCVVKRCLRGCDDRAKTQ